MKKGFNNIWLLFLLSVTVIWGGGFIVVRKALEYGLSPAAINLLRFSIASAAMLGVFFKNIVKITKKELLYGLISALFMTLGFGTQTYGMLYTSPANAALITGLYVVMIPFMTWVFSKKRPHVKVFLSAVLCFGSIGLLSFKGTSELNLGDLLCFAAALFFALHFIVLGYTTKKMNSGSLTFLQMLFSALFFLVYVLLFDFKGLSFSGADINAVWCVAYLSLLSTAYAYVIQTKAQAVVSPSYASLILSCEGLFGTVFAVIFGFEPLTLLLAFSAIGVTSAIIIVEYKPRSSLPPLPASEHPQQNSSSNE